MIFMALALAAWQLPPQPMTVEIARDPITDEVSAEATVRDFDGRLVVACDPEDYGGMRVRVHAKRWLARGNVFTGMRAFTYRFDAMPPDRMMWDIEDRTGTLVGRSRVEPFLAAMAVSDQLVIRARDVEEHEIDLVFRLADVAPAIAAVRETCGDWDAGFRLFGPFLLFRTGGGDEEESEEPAPEAPQAQEEVRED